MKSKKEAKSSIQEFPLDPLFIFSPQKQPIINGSAISNINKLNAISNYNFPLSSERNGMIRLPKIIKS